ncbi:MAG: hypothetical protein IJ168_04105 [Eubacterium sp.]|nr:hypothetical protein [Eubacterium sp.]
MKAVARWLMRIAVLVLILGIPFTALGGMSLLRSDGADAVSSATAYTFDPNDVSGEYVVFINNERHPDTLMVWESFFKGEDIPVVLDDISCLICNGDTLAADYAEICQARLPENQMTVKSDTSLLVLSKGEYRQFDIIILSKELAEAYGAESVSGQGITTVNVI